MRILLVEDEEQIRKMVMLNLEMENHEVIATDNGRKALELINSQYFDLIILDVMLPKIDGFALAQKFRDKDKNVPILFLTAKAMLEDKLQGFKLGGDDYITKPFSIDELVLKIEVFLKRSKVFTESAGMEKNTYDIAAYVFDFKELTLTNGKNTYTLTIREAELLRMLTINRNQVVRRESILHQVWGEDNYYIGRSLDVFVSRLRKMFADEPNVEIENVRGVGFKFIVKE